MRLRVAIGALAVVAVGGGVLLALRTSEPVATNKTPAPKSSASKPDAGLAVEDEDRSPALHPPTGKLASLGCASAGTILKEVRDELAFVPAEPAAHDFATATKDWIDPHGHWAVAPDAAPFASIDADAQTLLAEITRGSDCAAALRIGKKLASWVDAERARYDARASRSSGDSARALSDALDVVGRDAGAGAPPASVLTDELAERAGALKHAYGEPIARYWKMHAIASSRR